MQACRKKRAPGDSSWSRLFVSLSLCGLLLLGIQIERVASAPAGEDDAASPVGGSITTLPAMLDTTTQAAESAASTTTTTTTTTTTEATAAATTIGVEQSSASTAAESTKLDSSTTLGPNKLNTSEAGELENPKHENYRYKTNVASPRRVSKAFQTL